MKCACLCEEVMRITAVTKVAVRDAFQVTSWDFNRVPIIYSYFYFVCSSST